MSARTHIMHRTKSMLRLLLLTQLLASVVDQQTLNAQVRAAAAVTIEAESLLGSAEVTQGKLVPQNMQPFGSGWSGGSQLFWTATQPGAELRLLFPIGTSGRYEIFLHFTRAPDYAVVRASFDGAPWVTFNGYAPTVTRERALVAMRDLTPGQHELLFKVMTKDGPSQGLNVGIDRIELAPVGASVRIEGGTPPVPVLQIPSGTRLPQPETTQGVEPLSASARLSTIQKATSRQLKEIPGQPLRLTASQPRILNRASVYLIGGSFSPTATTDGAIDLYEESILGLLYYQLEPNQPQLLDCGLRLKQAGDIRVSADLFSNRDPKMQLYKMSLPQGEQRLALVLVPAVSHMWVVIRPENSTGFIFRYCELTAFK